MCDQAEFKKSSGNLIGSRNRQKSSHLTCYHRVDLFLSYFFVKKIPLSRPIGYVMDRSMDE